MATVLCTRTPGVACVRVAGHLGVCTACPSAATLDWDHDRVAISERHIEAACILLMLDFSTPPWANLHDDL
jgi:hypothetical protein